MLVFKLASPMQISLQWTSRDFIGKDDSNGNENLILKFDLLLLEVFCDNCILFALQRQVNYPVPGCVWAVLKVG